MSKSKVMNKIKLSESKKVEDYFRKKFSIPHDRNLKEFTLSGLTFEQYLEDMVYFYRLGSANALSNFAKHLDDVIEDTESDKKCNDTFVHWNIFLESIKNSIKTNITNRDYKIIA